MFNTSSVHVTDFGPVLLERSRRARRIIITIHPQKGIRVAVPSRTSFQSALEFVNRKEKWIRKTLARIHQLEIRQQALVDLFAGVDKEKAKKTLTTRLELLTVKHGFKYNRVSIRNQKTRWGSCSHQNNISLNIKLVLLPEELMDYVILHELVHTRVHNHSRRFWAELDEYVGDGKARALQLRKLGLGLL